METTQRDYNSTKNQAIKLELVENEISINLNQTIETLSTWRGHGLEGELNELTYIVDTEQSIINYLDSLEEDELLEICEEMAISYEEDTAKITEKIDNKNYFIIDNDIDIEYKEVYEYYAVSDHFAYKLREQGETVTELLDFNVWARCATGQAILLDDVIGRVAEEMEILDGQKYDWGKK